MQIPVINRTKITHILEIRDPIRTELILPLEYVSRFYTILRDLTAHLLTKPLGLSTSVYKEENEDFPESEITYRTNFTVTINNEEVKLIQIETKIHKKLYYSRCVKINEANVTTRVIIHRNTLDKLAEGDPQLRQIEDKLMSLVCGLFRLKSTNTIKIIDRISKTYISSISFEACTECHIIPLSPSEFANLMYLVKKLATKIRPDRKNMSVVYYRGKREIAEFYVRYYMIDDELVYTLDIDKLVPLIIKKLARRRR